MNASSRIGFLALILASALSACGDDDDDDDIGGEGEGEGEECDVRTCDAEGEQCCPTASGGTSCVNTNTSVNNCGECQSPCDELAANRCTDGSCACGVSAACDGTEESTCCPFAGRDAECVNTLTNNDACGSCNVSCVAPGLPERQSDQCVDGACVCGDVGEACTGMLASTCCPTEGGGAACTDVQVDPQNCAGCSLADRVDDEDHTRGDGILDEQFRCVPEVANMCRLAQCVCGIPKDIGVDPFPCAGGRASTCCAPANPDDAPLAVCADLDSDEAHCGQCNNPCAKGQTCTAGECG